MKYVKIGPRPDHFSERELREVDALLPDNYERIGVDGDTVWIAGEDQAGWTLEDYVVPRLKSGNFYSAEEIPESGVPSGFLPGAEVPMTGQQRVLDVRLTALKDAVDALVVADGQLSLGQTEALHEIERQYDRVRSTFDRMTGQRDREVDRVRRQSGPTKEERKDFELAHAQGLHDDVPRQFCPACEHLGRRA